MKLCVTFGWFFIDNFGLTNSFGLGSCMQRVMVSLHESELVRCPGKSMGESVGKVKVFYKWENHEVLDLETSPGLR